jgi:hypothetical protein
LIANGRCSFDFDKAGTVSSRTKFIRNFGTKLTGDPDVDTIIKLDTTPEEYRRIIAELEEL